MPWILYFRSHRKCGWPGHLMPVGLSLLPIRSRLILARIFRAPSRLEVDDVVDLWS
jgi:hypothetical protein